MAESWDHLEDWEEWDPESGTSFQVHALAGSLAGAAEHCAIFPFDTIKTHMQTEGATRQSLAEMVKRDGPKRLWRGVSTMFTACIPAHAAYFSIFEQSKMSFGADQEGHHPLAAAAAGALATIAHDSIMTPMDLLKQRLQLGLHDGMVDCARTVVRNEGVGALFISFPTTLLMNIPYAGVMVSANESFKKVLNPSGEYNLPVFFLSGGLSGVVAAAFTNPLDVAKTRLQTQSVVAERNRLLAKAAKTAKAGPGGPGGANGTPAAASSVGRTLAGVWSQGRALVGSVLPGTASPFAPGKGFRHVGQPSLGVSVSPYYSRACRFKNTPRPGAQAGVFGPANVKGTTTVSVPRSPAQTRKLFTAERPRPGAAVASSLVKGGARAHSTGANAAHPIKYHGLADTMHKIYRDEGWRGFTRGIRPRIMVHAPSVAISWSTYETAKNLLSDHF
ncbi:Mitoferrin (Mitochondrial substrate carrier family protein F) [Durusdinium trenchii]|uniref:Mitoferrin (Mitochondrial substrate carrier family protein F) n=1 Tax=Durusdinium trenchii TaxID=1381693 RepID=A0ABP0ML39_9DINO